MQRPRVPPRPAVNGETGCADMPTAATRQPIATARRFQELVPDANRVLPDASYWWPWFDPRQGEWSQLGETPVQANNSGRIDLPKLPSNGDWGLKLMLEGQTP